MLAATPLFARLAPQVAHPSPASGLPQSQTAQALHHVAGSVLQQLELAIGAIDGRATDPMWHDFAVMMRAELLMANARSIGPPDVEALLAASRTKSAAPFATMAEWMCLGPPTCGALRSHARRLGAAIGECFWLVDDARDVWEDLDRDRWNLFLIVAAKSDATIAAHPADMAAEVRLSRLLLTREWLPGLVRPVVAALRDAMASTPAPVPAQQEAAGLLATAMHRWLAA